MWTSLNKKLYVFMSIILVIGFIVGIVFVVLLDEATKEILFLNINEVLQNFSYVNTNDLIIHLVILSSLLILSMFLIGGPFVLFFLFFMFYNGFSIGFIISSLTCIFGIKGILFGSIYVIIYKLLFLIMLVVFSVNLFKIIKCVIDRIVNKNNNKESLVVFIKRSVIFIGIVLILDIILYFVGGKLVNLFNFLIS